MSSRSYDYILSLVDSTGFVSGNSVYGANSNTYAEVVSIGANNQVKVKLSNAYQEFEVGETVFSNTTPLDEFYEQYEFTSSPISVRSNNYGIDGSTNTFPLYRSVNFKNEILVYADGALVPQHQYEFPSQSLDKSGIDFNLKTIYTFSVGDDTTNLSDNIFPDTNISNLTIAVSRGIYTNEHFLASNSTPLQAQIASSTLSSIEPSNYVSIKNSFEQEPLVRLYSIYYPGEWYSPNTQDNPTGEGSGYPWPLNFPLRYAEVIGEDFSEPEYSVQYDNKEFRAFPINYPGISISSDGSIGEITLQLSTLDGSIPALIESAHIVGYNSTNAISATVNGESVSNIDPRTVIGNALYDADVATARGGNNVAFDFDSTQSIRGTWVSLIRDSRDLVGAVVEIKTTFASMLDTWPEYSIVDSTTSNIVFLKSTGPYRVGDLVRSNESLNTSTIVNVFNNNAIQVSNSTNMPDTVSGNKLLIENVNADSEGFVNQKFILTKLNSFTENTVEFTLANWTQKLVDSIPRRKYYKNTCPWKYKGNECQYPSSGSGVIANTTPQSSANGYFTISNATTLDASQDKCSKSIVSCALRNNIQHFGGFPGTNNDLQ